MKSWKTTLLGILVLIGAFVSGAMATFDSDPTTVIDMGEIIAAITGLGLFAARDNDKSSEDVGAVK